MNAFGVNDEIAKGYVGDKIVQVKTALERRKAKPKKANFALRPLKSMEAMMVPAKVVAKGATSAAWKAAFKATGTKAGDIASGAADAASSVPDKTFRFMAKHPNATAGAFLGAEAGAVGGIGYGGYKGAQAINRKRKKKP